MGLRRRHGRKDRDRRRGHVGGKSLMASLANGPAWSVKLPCGDEAEAETLDGALLAAATLIEESAEHGSPSKLQRAGVMLHRSGIYHGLATMLAREGFTRNPYSGKEQE